MVYITDLVIYILEKWYIQPTRLYILENGYILLGSLIQLVVAVGEWVSIVKFLAVSFVVNAQQVSVIHFNLSRTGCYLLWGFFYIVWTKEHSILRQNVSAGAKFV